jgi:carboxypeptidase C (cathepsin A)
MLFCGIKLSLSINNVTDKVNSMPDCAPLASNWYSGYIDVTETKSLHYVFIESLDKPASDPLIVWLQGGPGCSSMYGLLMESGPFIFDDGETVIKPN